MGIKFTKIGDKWPRELLNLRRQVAIPRYQPPEDIGEIAQRLVSRYAPTSGEQITRSLSRQQLMEKLVAPRRWDATDKSLLGNTSKTGTSFGLPAGRLGHSGTCPTCNQSEVCKNCYTNSLNYHQPDVILGQLRRQAISQTPQFVPRMIRDIIYAATNKRKSDLENISKELRQKNGTSDQISQAQRGFVTNFYIRGHDSGDFYSEDYIQKWIDIVQNVLNTLKELGLDDVIKIQYWFPTRVWTVKRFLAKLTELNSLDGVSIRPSAFSYDESPPEIEGLAAGSNVTINNRGTCPSIENAFVNEEFGLDLPHTCEGIGCRRCWQGREPISYSYHDPEGKRRLPDLSQSERQGQYHIVDVLLKMAQNNTCLYCGKPESECECYQDDFSNLNEELEEAHSMPRVFNALQKWGATDIYSPFPGVLRYALDGQIYVIDDFDYVSPKEAWRWLWDLSDWDLESYVTLPEFHDEFWKSGGKVYHSTSEENWELIQQEGALQLMDKTRGLSNRGTGHAIFTSLQPEQTEFYGDVLLEIDAGKMIADGYTPRVEREGPINEYEMQRAIAHKLGLNPEDIYDESSSDGISEDTVVFFQPIPLKYISRIS